MTSCILVACYKIWRNFVSPKCWFPEDKRRIYRFEIVTFLYKYPSQVEMLQL
jgi:hypothetical protein